MTTKNKAAQALRAIPSEARSEVSKTNGAKGGRPADPFKASLREAGIKWSWLADGQLKFYLRSDRPQRMRDGTFWNGTETIGKYWTWEQAKSCGSLASTISDRI